MNHKRKVREQIGFLTVAFGLGMGLGLVCPDANRQVALAIILISFLVGGFISELEKR